MREPGMLVVDDEAYNRTVLEEWFAAHGFCVDTAEDGLAAVQKCEHHRYDVVVMDFNMPRMNGKDAIRSIHTIWPRLPILVLTGRPGDALQAIGSGAERVLAKPMRLVTLENEVRKLMSPMMADGVEANEVERPMDT